MGEVADLGVEGVEMGAVVGRGVLGVMGGRGPLVVEGGLGV